MQPLAAAAAQFEIKCDATDMLNQSSVCIPMTLAAIQPVIMQPKNLFTKHTANTTGVRTDWLETNDYCLRAFILKFCYKSYS